MNKDIKALEKAIALLSDKSKWTTGWFARTKTGEKVLANSRVAVCWCAEGALIKYNFTRPWAVSGFAEELYGSQSISEVNDGPYGYRRVMSVLKKYLKVLRREERQATA